MKLWCAGESESESERLARVRGVVRIERESRRQMSCLLNYAAAAAFCR